MTADDVKGYLQHLCRQQIQQHEVDLALMSIALGCVETPLTRKDMSQRHWPADLQVSC